MSETTGAAALERDLPDHLSDLDTAALERVLRDQQHASARLERLVQQLHQTYGLKPGADRIWPDGAITRAGP